jgi:hypothetical protein
LNRPQVLPAMHRQWPAAKYLGLRCRHGRRLLDGLIVAKWNRFGIIANQNFFEQRGGRGFISLEGSRPASAPTLMQRFFLVPELLNYFLGIKNSNVDRCDFPRQNNAARPSEPRLSSIYFPAAAAERTAIRKMSRNYRGGVPHDGFF